MFYTKDSADLVGLSEQELKNLLGGKGAGLYRMSREGLPVPPFVVIPTTEWASYSANPAEFKASLDKYLPAITDYLRDALNPSAEDPYPLLSVRSGARVSCPGMMDTILNVGLDGTNFHHWVERLGVKCAHDCQRRLIKMYADVVKGVQIEAEKSMDALVDFNRKTGEAFPAAQAQLRDSICAVFESWNNERAKVYRKINQIPDHWGTAVVIQVMVFGNYDRKSGTGVLFTRNPDSGENKVVGEFLINAQGEDVVDGSHTPMPLDKMPEWNAQVADELLTLAGKLEERNRAVQDIEFTIQAGKLWILQTRSAKLSSKAAVKIGLDMLEEQMISVEEFRQRVSIRDIELAGQWVIAADAPEADWTGLPGCSGAVVGYVARTLEEVKAQKLQGHSVVFVAKETTPDDIESMQLADGVLTMKGGATSHAAVVARSMNRPCVVGLGKTLGAFRTGKQITICGQSGRVWAQAVKIVGGDHGLGSKALGLLIGDAKVVVRGPIKYRVKNLVLDLREYLLSDDEEIKAVITGCAINCERLWLMAIPQLTPHQEQTVGVFFTKAAQLERLEQIRKLVEQSLLLVPDPVLIGWYAPGVENIPVVDGDLKALIELKNDALLVDTGGLDQNQLRMIKLLGLDGITLRPFKDAGMADLTEHLAK